MSRSPSDKPPGTLPVTSWYRSGYVWMVLTPLIVVVFGMLLTIIIMARSGALQQHPDLGQPLGKIYTGSQPPAAADAPEKTADDD